MDRAFSTNRGEEECIKDFCGKARRKETKGPLGRPRRKREGNTCITIAYFPHNWKNNFSGFDSNGA
jgi:hypothetical protein